MPKIEKIYAFEVLDSRGDPTVAVQLILDDGNIATASVPSGASTGTYEAFELRDNDSSRYGGKGVLTAVNNIEQTIAKALIGMDPTDQQAIDKKMIELDGSENKRMLGANAILGVSMAVARAGARVKKLPLYKHLRDLAQYDESSYQLPIPLINVINGGKHASTNLNIQEFWIIPTEPQSFSEQLRHGSEIFHTLGKYLTEHKKSINLGNEGGYAPDFDSHTQVLDMIVDSITRAGYTPGKDVYLGIDAGSSVFFNAATGRYTLDLDMNQYTSQEFIDMYLHWLDKYPILAIEDGLAEEEWAAWKDFTARVKEAKPMVRLVGDDLFVTNAQRLQRGVQEGVANSILVKPNQIGTVSETLETIMLAKKNRYQTAVSHRSGETTDDFIADLCVAVNSEFIKTGSTARGERTAKYNRLLAIEHDLKNQ